MICENNDSSLSSALPIPTLSTMVEIKDICDKFNRATNPNELGYTFEQLKSLDDVHVSLIPEKKGTLLKHNEYLVESRVSNVYRVHELLGYREGELSSLQ